jgi:glycerol uptake facilitator-like aquaporin
MSAEKQELIAEFLGSFFLALAAVTPMILFPEILGSSISVAVIADALAVGFVLSVLIDMFGPISGAHFNPIVTLMMVKLNRMPTKKSGVYLVAQVFGGLLGVLGSHLMFYHQIPVIATISEINRSGGNYLGEIIGTLILLLAILTLLKNENPRMGWNIGVLVGGQLMATSSTMFANPMITIARTFTYSAAGIRPIDSLMFILMQFIGLGLALIIWRQIEEK